MATVAMPLPAGLNITVLAKPLTPEAFAPFGEVIQNPRPDVQPSQLADAGPLPLPFGAVSANQGSAIQYQHVTRMVNNYGKAPSGVSATAVVNMFVSAARRLQRHRPGSRPGASATSTSLSSSFFEVNILERHPFTTQTFTPLSISGTAASKSQNCYLVIVVPNLVTASGAQGRGADVPVSSPPDLSGLKAFIATTGQAVTYGAGTWHAPMVALGPEGSTVDFVVTQFKNAVGEEDCQMVSLASAGDGRVCVEVPVASSEFKPKL